MAERRMFAKGITSTDAFLALPMSSQALYFHLGMWADDDGFVGSPKRIMRMIGAADDDISILIMKRFVIAFQSGVIVIKHWRMQNLLRRDRYTPTNYQDEKALLVVKNNGAYTEKDTPPALDDGNQVATVGIPSGNQVATDWQPDGNHLAPQYSIGKYNPPIPPHGGHARASKKNQEDPLFARFWSEYPRKTNKPGALKAFANINPSEDLLKLMLSALKKQKASRQWTKDNGEFIPHPATWLNQERWNDEIGRAHEEEDSLDGYILE